MDDNENENSGNEYVDDQEIERLLDESGPYVDGRMLMLFIGDVIVVTAAVIYTLLRQ